MPRTKTLKEPVGKINNNDLKRAAKRKELAIAEIDNATKELKKIELNQEKLIANLDRLTTDFNERLNSLKSDFNDREKVIRQAIKDTADAYEKTLDVIRQEASENYMVKKEHIETILKD